MRCLRVSTEFASLASFHEILILRTCASRQVSSLHHARIVDGYSASGSITLTFGVADHNIS